MKLRDYILSNKNIYLAIYAVRSYVFDPCLLTHEDKVLLNILADPFNEDKLNAVVENVRKRLAAILDNEKFFFDTEVYFKPKEYNEVQPIYRPIHTAKLIELIAMVALLNLLVYEIPTEKNNWKLNLSNYSRLIPNNFYGNRVSKRPEELFERWNKQYKKYTQKSNEYFKTFHESQEYRYEVKLDLRNFFPSIDPRAIYGILLENLPVTITDDFEVEVFKKVIYKLLVCKITNLDNNVTKEIYYNKELINATYTRGIAQGLPQAYFFGNICMIKISEIFEKAFSGKAVYYVDDSYIYTNRVIRDDEDFKEQLEGINDEIENMISGYISKAKDDKLFFSNRKYGKINELEDSAYKIEVHTEGKSTYVRIQDSKEGEVYLRTLSREASQIGEDIKSTYSEEEDETLLHRMESLLQCIELEKNSDSTGATQSYKDKLERYYKFFKYRVIKLRLKTENDLSRVIFDVLTGKSSEADSQIGYSSLSQKIDSKTFFTYYRNDIWQTAISILIDNTLYEHDAIKEYINMIIDIAYSKQMLECSYIKKEYEDYINGIDVDNICNCYETLEKRINKKMVRFAHMNGNVLKKEFNGVKIRGLADNILRSFGICSDNFIDMVTIVDSNSNRLQRMFLNAVYSKVFKVAISEDVVINTYDKKGVTYGELRVLAYLRNVKCDVQKFLNWQMELMGADNLKKVDFTLFEVLGAYKTYVMLPDNIDSLIMVHKYTCDVWKNGAKHLYFYTLHNQEHAVDLVKNIIKIVKVFNYLKISNYDYFILFISCYLHDISMVRIASENDFLLDKDKSDKIVTESEEKWSPYISTNETKKAIVSIYKSVDDFFEYKIRSSHAKDSGEEIRKRKELNFLEPSVRENVADVSESHMMDTKDIYFVKGDAKERLISLKFDKILLRIADLLDMCEHRVSKPILRHNIDNMSSISAFHWISHLLTAGYRLVSNYSVNYKNGEFSNLSPGSIKEIVTLSVFVNLSQFSKMESKKCIHGGIKEDTVSNDGFELELYDGNLMCDSKKCNFLCRWFNEKNNYLIQEMQALELYLNRVPATERFYETKIKIKVVVLNPTDISDEQFEILRKNISD